MAAKDFELNSIDGRAVKLSNLKGKVVLIDFWATWCAPCLKAAPHLAKLYEQYRARGFEILAISVDEPADRHLLRPFAEEHKINFPVLLDDGVQNVYEARFLPTTLFLDRAAISGSSTSAFRRMKLRGY